MTNEEVLQCARDYIKDYNTKHGGKGGLASLCTLTKISDAILSPLLKGTYKGNVQTQIDSLEEYFTVKSEHKATYQKVKYAPTSTSKLVYNTIRGCHIRGGFAIITGDSGVGKTKAAMKYVADNPESAVMITVNPACKSTKSVLKELTKALGIAYQRSVDDTWYAVASKLHDGMVIVADEAQLLTFHGIEVLRSFSDYFDNRDQTLGIALIGNDGIRERIEGKSHEMYRQINNRAWHRPQIYTKDLKLSDVAMIFPQFEPDSPEIKFLWKLSHGEEGLRGAVTICSLAYEAIKDSNETCDIKWLAAVAKETSVSLKGVNLSDL